MAQTEQRTAQIQQVVAKLVVSLHSTSRQDENEPWDSVPSCRRFTRVSGNLAGNPEVSLLNFPEISLLNFPEVSLL